MQVFLPTQKGVLREVLLAALGGADGGKTAAPLDEKIEKLMEGKKVLDCPEVSFFFALLVVDYMMKTNAPQVTFSVISVEVA